MTMSIVGKSPRVWAQVSPIVCEREPALRTAFAQHAHAIATVQQTQ
jgi:hypothetical protein